MLTLFELIYIINEDYNSLEEKKLQAIFAQNLSEDKLIEEIRDYFDISALTQELIAKYIDSKFQEDRLLPAEESVEEKEQELKRLKNRLKIKDKKDGN